MIPYILIQQENIRCLATQLLCPSERTKRVTEFKWLTVKLLVVIKFFSRLFSPPETYFKIVNKVAVIGLISRILQFGIVFSLDTVQFRLCEQSCLKLMVQRAVVNASADKFITSRAMKRNHSFSSTLFG